MIQRQIILDTETTGLSTAEGHRLIEVGCLEMINRRFTGRHFHRYINPERAVDVGAFQVHGIANEFLKDKPLFSQIADELQAFIHGAELIIHNATFDVGFLNYEFNRLERKYPPIHDICTVLDTLPLARSKHPGQSNSLDALCRRYQVDNTKRDLHGALLDARLLAQVYLAMTGGQEQLFINDDITANATIVEEITHISQPDSKRESLVILQPTESELTAHAEFLAMLKKTGRCVWQEAATEQTEQ